MWHGIAYSHVYHLPVKSFFDFLTFRFLRACESVDLDESEELPAEPEDDSSPLSSFLNLPFLPGLSI